MDMLHTVFKDTLDKQKDKLAKIDDTIKDWESIKSAASSMSYGGEQDIEIGADKQEEILKDCDATIERLKKEKENIEKEMSSLQESTYSEINKIKEMMGLTSEKVKDDKLVNKEKTMTSEAKKMTSAQKNKKEDIVKGMKKSGSFGKSKEEKGKMYATATKLAKKK
jgi:hypothetical protein